MIDLKKKIVIPGVRPRNQGELRATSFMRPEALEQKLLSAREYIFKEDYCRAFEIYEVLVRKFPDNKVIWFEYGGAAAALLKMDIAECAWVRACELSPDDSELLLQVGHNYKKLRQSDRARFYYTRAARLNPKAVDPIVSLAVIYERSNCLQEARECVLDCLKINGRDEQGLYLLALLDFREGKLSEAESRFRDLIASDPKHPYVQWAARFELAQVLDRTGDVDNAMRYLREGKGIIQSCLDTRPLMELFKKHAKAYYYRVKGTPKSVLRLWAKTAPGLPDASAPRPVFLGGHPRSGTTLLEQVLSRHPRITAIDEPISFPRLIAPAMGKIKKWDRKHHNTLRENYFRGILAETGARPVESILVDKNPSLTMHLHSLLRVFPELRVVIALRDPRAVVLSCYFLNVPLNTTNVNFLSLEGTVEHYKSLMDVWLLVRQWEGFSWIETRYEDIVADLHKEGQRVTEFLGVEWDETQSRFYEASEHNAVNSPTYHEVKKKIYQHAVTRWRAYERHLAPVLSALKPYCAAFGYDQ